MAAVCLGLVAGALCAIFVDLKYRFGFDDSLDVVGVHLGGGLIGTLALGFIALPVDGQGGGLFYGGGFQQLVAQTVAVLITVLLSGLVTAVLGVVIHKTLGFRVSEEAETAGVDLSEHAETAYAFGELSRSRFNPFHHHATAPEGTHEETRRTAGRGCGAGEGRKLRLGLRTGAGPGVEGPAAVWEGPPDVPGVVPSALLTF